MKNYLLFSLIASVQVPPVPLIQNPLALEHEKELAIVERLIEMSEKQLAGQKELKKLIPEFERQLELFMVGIENKRHVGSMARNARRIQELIAEQHLQHHFSTEYLEELSVIGSVGKKISPKSP